MQSLRPYNAIVIGLGAMGSATLYHLAMRGWRVLGLEQSTPANTLGSSHGDSRIIREMYFEHPLYVPLVQRAYELWTDLENESGKSLMTINGGLMIGPPDGYVVKGTLRSASEHNLPFEVLDSNETRKRFPAFQLRDDLVAVLDPRAGFLDPESCVTTHVQMAVAAGAETRFNEPLLSWTPDGDGVRVVTARAEYLADFLVMAGGGWNRQLLRDISVDLVVERQVLFWFEPEGDPSIYGASRFPIYAYEDEPGHFCYGFPRLSKGVKAAGMHSGEKAADPSDIRRSIGDDEVAPLRSALRAVLPGLSAAPIRESTTCIFTNTPDGDFLIDFHPAYKQVLISSPCSGHGFKFSSAIGELQADLLTKGETRFDIAPFRLDRSERGIA